MRAAPIRAELVPTNFSTRYSCHCCGGSTERVGVLCEVPESHPTHAGFRVCERCLEAGNPAEKMRKHVDALEQRAAALRDIADRLQVPSFADWQHAERVADACLVLYQATDDFETPKSEALAWPIERQMEIIARAKEAYDAITAARELRRRAAQ